MPRETQRRPSGRPIVDLTTPRSSPVQAGVFARQHQYSVSSEGVHLARALSEAAGAYGQYKDNADKRDAQAAFTTDNPSDYAVATAKTADKGAGFRRGYMALYGYKVGAQVEAELLAGWEKGEYDRESGDVDGYINKVVGERFKGLDDVEVKAAAAPLIERAKAQLYSRQQQFNAQKIEEGLLANAGALIDLALKDGAMNTPEGRDTIYAKLREAGLENREIDDLLVQRVVSEGDRGKPEVYDVIIQRGKDGTLVGHKRKDGTPGLFDIPKYNSLIKDGLYRAEMHEVAMYEKVERLNGLKLKQVQDTNAGEFWSRVFAGDDISIDIENARKTQAISNSDYVTIVRFSREARNSPDLIDDPEVVVKLEDDLYGKRAGRKQVLAAWKNGDVSRATVSRLFGIADEVSNRQEFNVFDSDAYKFSEEFVEGHLAPGLMDIDASVKKRLTANAKRELRTRALAGENPHDVANDIVKRYGKKDTSGTLPKPLYPSKEALIAARKAGEVSPEVFLREWTLMQNLPDTIPKVPNQ